MDQVWLVAALWSLVGVAAVLIATWLGASLRDEFLNARKELGRPKTLWLTRGGKLTITPRRRRSVASTRLISVRGGSGTAPVLSRPNE